MTTPVNDRRSEPGEQSARARRRSLREHHLAVNAPRFRLAVQLTIDLLVWPVAVIAAVLVTERSWDTWLLLPVGLAMLVQLAVGFGTGLYVRRFAYAGPEDMRRAALCGVVGIAVLQIVSPLVMNWHLLMSLLTTLLALVGLLGSRHVIRTVLDRWRRPQNADRVVIVGIGHTGTSLAGQMVRDQDSPYVPAAFVDDDPSKRRMRAHGVGVLGPVDQLADIVRSVDAVGVVVAIRTADRTLLRRLSDELVGTGTWIRVVPMLHESVSRTVTLNDIRELSPEDLLGRRPVNIDQAAVRRLLTGKRILITGAGGSIGSELTRQISELDPAELIMLDRDETALHSLKMTLSGRATLDTPDTVLADIRDADRLVEVFDHYRPEVVFHAAALKHLPLLEQYPKEAWQTNVHGTANVLRAAERAGVRTLINVSTDKAADPTSVLGSSKRTAERLTASFARPDQLRLSVRFGNVLGSRGSVLYAFADQIRRGGPVTVTHPDVTRYFMTIPEACQLMLQAAVIGEQGQVLVLEMGQPFKIVDVARKLMAMEGRDCDIVYTGLRPGEKLDEVLFSDKELAEVADAPRLHDKIFHATVPALDPAMLPEPSASLERVWAFWQADRPQSHPASAPASAPAPLSAPAVTSPAVSQPSMFSSDRPAPGTRTRGGRPVEKVSAS